MALLHRAAYGCLGVGLLLAHLGWQTRLGDHPRWGEVVRTLAFALLLGGDLVALDLLPPS